MSSWDIRLMSKNCFRTFYDRKRNRKQKLEQGYGAFFWFLLGQNDMVLAVLVPQHWCKWLHSPHLPCPLMVPDPPHTLESGSSYSFKIVSSVESLQSHFIHTMSHWSSGLPVCFPSQGTQVQIPRGVLMWNRDSPVSVVSLHWWPRRGWSSLWPRPELSLGPRADNVIIPLDLTQLSCPGFTLATGLPSGFTTDGVGYWRGALWRTCNLTSFSPCLTGLVDYLFASRHKGPRFKSPGGVLMWNWDSPVCVVSLQFKWILWRYGIDGWTLDKKQYVGSILVSIAPMFSLPRHLFFLLSVSSSPLFRRLRNHLPPQNN